MNRALMAGGGVIGAKGVLQSLFATQVATGSGLTGAAASLSAISTGAVAATAGIAALVGTLGWVAYKTWKIRDRIEPQVPLSVHRGTLLLPERDL